MRHLGHHLALALGRHHEPPRLISKLLGKRAFPRRAPGAPRLPADCLALFRRRLLPEKKRLANSAHLRADSRGIIIN